MISTRKKALSAFVAGFLLLGGGAYASAEDAPRAASAGLAAPEECEPQSDCPAPGDGSTSRPRTDEIGGVNTEFHIVDVAPTNARGSKGAVGGVAVTYMVPDGRDAYGSGDWIAVYEGTSTKPFRWEWALGDCSSYCTRTVEKKLQSGKQYTIVYYRDGGTVSQGTPVATFDYWA
ncbi:hypothetical protein [Kitasatospora sp. NPDC096204]|uniref:hypothetical protein n=1 Tax=Kitasatospora sp. NPDC096204 TaxID=3364094 RepID=UPI00382ECC38